MFLKVSQNLQKAIYAGFSFSIKLKVVDWKESPVQVHSCESCEIFKNDYLVVHERTTVSDILGYPDVGIFSTRSTLKKYTVFFRILEIIHFKLILEFCKTSGVYLATCQTSVMLKRFVIDIWQALNTALQPHF